MTATLGIVALGFGGIGTQDHQTAMYLPALLAHPGYDVLGAADVGAARGAGDAGNRWNLRTFLDVPSALAAPGLEAVCVAAPFEHRVSVVRAAIAAGKHVLVDKPMAPTSAEAERLTAAADERGVVLMPAHHQRLHDSLRRARESIVRGDIGRPLSVTAEFIVAGGDVAPTGELVNLGLYPVDVVQWLLGSPVRTVHATAGRYWNEAADDLVTLLQTHAGCSQSTVICARTLELDGIRPAGLAIHRYRVIGTAGVLLVDAAEPDLDVRTTASTAVRSAEAGTMPALLDAFLAAVRASVQQLGGRDAVEVQAAVEAAQESLRSGRPEPVGAPRSWEAR